jgi:hypothetical protein
MKQQRSMWATSRSTLTVLAATAVIACAGAAGVASADTAGQTGGDADADAVQPPEGVAVQLAAPVTCNGGASKRLHTGGTADGINASEGTAETVPGTVHRIKGPKRGKDTVLVTFSANAYTGATSTEGRVRVLLDGQAMAPGDQYTQLSSGLGYDTASLQFCRKIGPGFHDLSVQVSAVDGTATNGYLYVDSALVSVDVRE